MSSVSGAKRGREEGADQLDAGVPSPPKRAHIKLSDRSVDITEIYRAAGLQITQEPEKQREYDARHFAYTFGLDGKKVAYRYIVPEDDKFKLSFWKRPGVQPIEDSDGIDFLVADVAGKAQYIFDQKTLIDQDIIATKEYKGKINFIVYLPDAKLPTKKAQEAKKWQMKHYVALNADGTPDCAKIRKLFKMQPLPPTNVYRL